jgi:hypothetical protein
MTPESAYPLLVELQQLAQRRSYSSGGFVNRKAAWIEVCRAVPTTIRLHGWKERRKAMRDLIGANRIIFDAAFRQELSEFMKVFAVAMLHRKLQIEVQEKAEKPVVQKI